MKKLYCVICRKYKKFEKPKVSYMLEKTLALSTIWSKYKNEDKKYLKKKKQLRYQKLLVWLKTYNYFNNKCQEFKLKYVDETRNYSPKEI